MAGGSCCECAFGKVTGCRMSWTRSLFRPSTVPIARGAHAGLGDCQPT